MLYRGDLHLPCTSQSETLVVKDTPIFTIALKNSSIFSFNNGRHSLEVLRIISLMFSPIICVVWRCVLNDVWRYVLRMICFISNVWVKSRWATRNVIGYGDCCLKIKPTMAKSVNSSYVVFLIVVSWSRDSIKTPLEMLVILSSPKW